MNDIQTAGARAARNLAPELAGARRDVFFYTLEVTPLPAGGTKPAHITVDTTHDFYVVGLVRVVTDAADAAEVAFAPLLVTFNNASTGGDFQAAPVHLEAVAGTARQPAELATPIRIPAGSRFSATFASKAAAALNVRLVLLGFRVARGG